MRDALIHHLRAGFAGLYLLSHEEPRVEAVLADVCQHLKYQLYTWTLTQGMSNPATQQTEQITDPVAAVARLAELPEQTLLLLPDFHVFLGDASQPANPLLTRTLKEALRLARTKRQAVLILGCRLCLPPELEKEFTILALPLPEPRVLAVIAEHLAEAAGITVDETAVNAAADAARGLTTQEAEDLLALSLVTDRSFNPTRIARDKALAVKKSGLLEIIDTSATAADIGGLDGLKDWLAKRQGAFSPAARAYGLPSPKGVLILGPPGTGKSLTAKAAAHILGRPLLKLDPGRLFAGLVGESEANLRRALATAEAVAPCVLMLEELEKGLAGSKSSGSTDGGTSARVFGSLLNWLQDKESQVFVIATANDVSLLPPELLRKGRFDEVFYCDLPSATEREAIWRIHLTHKQRNPSAFDLPALAAASDTFTGAEIEQALVDALFDGYAAEQELTQSLLLSAVRRTVPLATTMSEDIARLRTWAKDRTRSASGVNAMSAGKTNVRRVAA